MKKLIAFLILLLPSSAFALTLSDIRNEIRERIDDKADPKIRYTDKKLNNLINQAQRDVVNNTWCVSRSTSITLAVGTTFYTLPSDLIAIDRATRQYGNLPEVSLMQQDVDNNNTAWETTAGTPLYFFQDKSQKTKIGLAPYPSSASDAGTLRIIYFSTAPDLSADSDVPFNSEVRLTNYQDLLVYYPCYRIFLGEGDKEQATFFRQEYESRLAIMNENLGIKPSRISVPKESKQ